MGKYKSMMQALAPGPDDIPRGESDAVYYRLGFNQARGAAVLLAGDADALDEQVIRLSKERDEARAEVARLIDRNRQIEELAAMERMTSENNEEAMAVANRERDDARAEVERLKERFGLALAIHYPNSCGDLWEMARMVECVRKERDDLREAVKELHERSERLAAERDEVREAGRTVVEELERLTKERDDLVNKVGPIILAPPVDEIERLTKERDEATGELAKSLSDGRKQDAKELARLRSIIRQMVRDEAERKIEALGVGEDGGSEHLVYVRPRFGKQRCECRLQAGDSPCPVHVQRDAGEGGHG